MIEDVKASAGVDGTSVDVDLQMAKLSENADSYRMLGRMLKHEFEDLKMAIEKTN